MTTADRVDAIVKLLELKGLISDEEVEMMHRMLTARKHSHIWGEEDYKGYPMLGVMQDA